MLENRKAASPSHFRAARLALPNDFPARDRHFISSLSADLHLSVQWDEYDEQDVNLVTWRFPRVVDDGKGKPESKKETEEVVEDGAEENSDEWEDEEDDEEEDAESRVAVDRVLKKYEKAPVEDLDAQSTFDERYERSVKEKMDEWKRGYYQVRFSLILCMYSIKICVLILGR